MNAFAAPATGTPLVSFRQVRKHFAVDGRRLEAIQQFDLEIGEGEFIAIVGASGCGKSTLLRLLIGLDRDYDGEIRVDGRPIAGIGGERGIVFQEHRLFPWLTVQQNVALGLVNEALGETDKAARIDEYIRLVGLHGFERAYPHQLSGGMAQRVAIARGLVASPRLLLLDEPFSALDYKLRRAMQLEIKRLQRRLGITFVFVTHDQEEAFAMSDRVVVMNQGRIEQIGTPQEIYEEPSNLYVARFVGEINILPARIMSVPGEGIYIAEISGRRFTLRTSRSFAAGDRVNVLLRPEDIRVYAHDDERPEGPYLTGRIEETVYKGATVDISIALDSGETLSVAEFFNEDDAEISYNRGERVAVTWVDGWEVVLPYEAD